ncbi:signal transduction histidine kinase/ligand-binding sensor domain-containing protein [Filimonas zeae]|uniref:histidine kinase n=1 Tax=Filimonas zeae TaxID=1737353 RepID=A0A917IWY8_9BACT|nr:sensor histidine kinase [Filimonas zeae]MDR6339329.1 signal transduction histidine kinase/ligand-binding sensor domain-containing protein [Filimonas zeae]GGH64093.1 hybrid sensor histidine kinase/response regulator [Filimonas zeae]
MRKTIIICLLITLFLIKTGVSQQYNFRHYQVENGLSNNAVISLLQDSSHFIWLGTKDGLNRFDGYRFKIFRHHAGNPKSIGSNFIHCLQEGSNGTLWVGTDKGIYRYDAVSESFENLLEQLTGIVSDIKTDATGNVWFIMNQTLYRYELPAKQLVLYTPAQFGYFTSLCILPDNTLCLGTPEGLVKHYNPGANTFRTTEMFSHSPAVSSRWIERVYAVDNNRVLVGTSNQGAKMLHLPAYTYTDILTHENNTDVFVRNFLRVSDSLVWIASESGIFIYNLLTRHYINLQKAYNNPYSLSDNAVYAFCKDKEGGIWAGSYFGGANYYPVPHADFQKLFPMPGKNSLSGNVVREITGDAYGNIWIGTEDAGLNRLDVKTGQLKTYLPTGQQGSIAYTNIHGLLADGNRLWIGTFEHGLDIMDIASGKIIQHFSKGNRPGELQSNFIHCITKTHIGQILLGTTIGAYRFEPASRTFIPLPDMPVNNWYSFIKETKDGTVWAATYGNGVRFYNPFTGATGNLIYKPGTKICLPDNRVNSIYEDSRQQLWFGTEGGLARWNPKDSSFYTYTIADGLPTDYILSILEDSRKNLWISTSKGLAMLSATTGKFTVYTTNNGLLSDQFNFNSAWKDSSGKMYFGSARGLTLFQPDLFTESPFTPPVLITGIQVFNQELSIGTPGSPLQQSVSYTGSISLPHDQSTISIDFAALGFSAPEMTAYAYRMNGLDEDWVYLTQNRKAFFTGLPPGQYLFEVKAAAGNGRWSSTPATLAIEIRPPWWATGWAYFIYILLSAFGLVYILLAYHQYTEARNKRKYEQLKAAKEKEFLTAKIEFFTNVAHEVKTPLSLIKGPLEKILKKAESNKDIAGYLGIMERNTNRLIDLTNQLLDFRETEMNGFSLNLTQTNISELLKETYNSFNPLAEEKGLRYRIQYPPREVEAFIDTDAFKKIIYNLFSNAIKYSRREAIVTLHAVQAADSFFRIDFQSDGVTIPEHLHEKVFEPFYRMPETASEQGTGIGLTLSRSLAQLHGGQISISNSATGVNIFSLQLPLLQQGKNHSSVPTNQ